MLAYLIERLETLSDEHLKEIADLSAQAFAGDVAWTALIGGDWSLNREYCNAVLRAAILEGEVYILTIAKGERKEIASWVVWFPPGRALFKTEAQRALGFNDLFKKIKPEVQDWLTNTYPKYIAKFKDEVFTKEEQRLHWWCYDLATRPDLQGKGFGTALMDIVYQKAKKTKELGTFLGLMTQTDENVNKYASMGFKKIGGMEFPMPGGTSTYLYLMIRKP